jgi:long-chain fatty acid transport protein
MFPEGEFRVGTGDIQNFNGATGQAGTYKMDLEYPQQFAVGVAVTPIEPLLVAFDVKWINWSGTHDKVKFSGPEGSFVPAFNPTGSSSSTELNFGWDDQWVYALGLQYRANERLTVRTGFNYSESPIDEADVFNNLVFPAIVEKHFALGFDYMLGEHWGIGATYMKAFREELTGTGDLDPAMGFGTDSNAKISLEEDSLGVQLTYLF